MRVSPAARARASKRRSERLREPGYEEWHAAHRGVCQVCGVRGPLVRHHIVTEQVVRRYGGSPWDLANALEVGAPLMWGGNCSCHDHHHHRGVNDRRIPFDVVPPAAVRFACELMGDEPARAYFQRRYAP